MAQRVCIIGGGVIGLATAYALVRDGFEVTVIEARDALGSETSFAMVGNSPIATSHLWLTPVCRCKPLAGCCAAIHP